jgi:hypothetical protein
MQTIDLAIVIGLIVLAFCAIVVSATYQDSLKPGFDSWAYIRGLVEIAGIISIALPLVIYLHKERNDRNKEQKSREDRFNRSCGALLREIEENRNHITPTVRRHYIYVMSRRREPVDYSNVFFETYAYQSIIHSGLLTYFKEDIQARLAQLYSRIDRHNTNLDYRTHLETEFRLFGRREKEENWLLFSEQGEQYDLFLTKTDGDIRNLFPDVEQSLKELRQGSMIMV